MHSGLVLDIEGAKHGANIITYPKHGGENQLWKWNGRSIISKMGYALDIEGGKAEKGANIIAWNNHGGHNQQFRMRGNKIFSEFNGLCLDIKGGSRDSNIPIITWPIKSEGEVSNQSWELEYE